MDIREIILKETGAALELDLKKDYENADTPVSYLRAGQWKDKQIKNALNGFAAGCRLQDAVVLCDLTLFDSGKKGILFSTEGVYCNDFNLDRKKDPLPMPVKYKDLAKVYAAYQDDEIQLTFTDGRVEKVFCSIYTGYIAASLNGILSAMREEDDPGQAEQTDEADELDQMLQSDEVTSTLDRMFSGELSDRIRQNLNKVLIAGGSAFMRTLLKDIVRHTGFEACWEASDGKEAVDLFREHRPGLTILDADLPEMDGIAALEEIRKCSDSSYVIIAASARTQEIYDRCANAGAHRVIYKPIKEEEMARAIKDLLDPGWDWELHVD